MAVSLHLYFGLKAAFEFKSKVAVVNGDTLDQLSDQPFVVVRHRCISHSKGSSSVLKPASNRCLPQSGYRQQSTPAR